MNRPPAPDDPLAALVAAWHNRKLLARRVRPRHVQGMGVVTLPFRRIAQDPAAPRPPATLLAGETTTARAVPAAEGPGEPQAAAALEGVALALPDEPAGAPGPAAPRPPAPPRPWARAWARWRQRLERAPAPPRVQPALQGLEPLFSRNYLASLAGTDVARFALEHGSLERQGGEDWPRRELGADLGEGTVTVYLRTAAIEIGGQRVRVLIGQGAQPAIVGSRITSAWRAALLAGGLSAVLSAVAAGLAALSVGDLGFGGLATRPSPVVVQTVTPKVSPPPRAAAREPDAQPAEPAAAVPPVQVARAEAAAGPAGASAALPAAPQAAVPASAAASAAGTPPRAEAPPARGAGGPIASIVPRLSEQERAAARAQSESLRGPKSVAAPRAAASGAAGAAPGRYFALVTRTTRSRAASEIIQSLMDSAASGGEFAGAPRIEVMPVGGGFRAVWWPFRTQAEAQRGQAVLASFGIKAELIAF